MPRDTFLVYGAPEIDSDEIAEVVDCLQTGWLSTGPKVTRFERDFAPTKVWIRPLQSAHAQRPSI